MGSTGARRGHGTAMTEPVKDAVQETARGRHPSTQLFALSGVTLIVGAIVVIILAAAFLAYYLS
jgi:hypothetical protein